MGLLLGPFIQSRKCTSFMCHNNEEWFKIWRGIDLTVQNWHEEFSKFRPGHSKISKICTLMSCFWPKYIMFELSKCREVMFDDTQDWYKVWRKTDLCFQKWREEFGKFPPEHLKVSKSYVLWQWRMIQNLEKNWLVSSKLICGIWRILTQALENLKNLHINGLLLTKVYNVWAKKVQRSRVWWHWILMQNLKENWMVVPKAAWGSQQIFTRACLNV